MANQLIAQDFTLPCGARLKNRIAKAAMSENMSTPDHRANELFETLYKRWSNGGAGLLITGNIMIDRSALGEPANIVLEKGMDVREIKKWAKAASQNNTHVWVQLNHPGKQSPKFLSKTPVAPSAISLRAPLDKMFNKPRALSEIEIENIIERFGDAAKICQEAGFTGVQIHGAHGYLVSQFLSPIHNQRQDKWGGSLENRMRFVIAVYEKIRQTVGPAFPVSIKLNSADFQKGGFTKEESMKVVCTLADKGMDLIEISGGSYEAPEMMSTKKASTAAREAYFLEYCEEIRKLTDTPLMLTGGFRSLIGMNAALASVACDIVGLGRSMVLNPDLPNELLANREMKNEIKPLSTGIKALDKIIPLEISWYTNQIHRMGKGLDPKPDRNATFSILETLYTMGIQGLKRVR